MILRTALLLLCALTVGFAADQWDSFRAGAVLSYGCSVDLVALQMHGSTFVKEIYEARATAKRHELPDWNMTIGEFPSTLSGRHKAEKVCSKWLDEAHKRVNKK